MGLPDDDDDLAECTPKITALHVAVRPPQIGFMPGVVEGVNRQRQSAARARDPARPGPRRKESRPQERPAPGRDPSITGRSPGEREAGPPAALWEPEAPAGREARR